MSERIRLTKTVKKGGCAAKVAAHELRGILQSVIFPKPQNKVLINGSDFDDAAVYKISEDLCLIETIDFFTPIVDDPYLFGQVAAANAMSDVYAMGGKPKTALAVLAFPLMELDKAVVSSILQGAIDKLQEAGADLVGGHSIDDDTLKFGLSVMGTAKTDQLWINKKSQAGDVLILTKALGTGTLMAALKNDVFDENRVVDAFASMKQLNHISDLLSMDELCSIHAATDVTGFGLAGHSFNLAKASDVSIRINACKLPILPHAFEALQQDCLTKAHRTNKEYVGSDCKMSETLSRAEELIFFDPQTSGGLLLSVDAGFSKSILKKLQERFPQASIVGEVVEKSDHRILYES